MSAQSFSSQSDFSIESRGAAMCERDQTVGVTNSSRAVVSMPTITYQNPAPPGRCNEVKLRGSISETDIDIF